MRFKLDKKSEKSQLVLTAYRLPLDLRKRLKAVAKREGISETKLVIQMLIHCLSEIEKI